MTLGRKNWTKSDKGEDMGLLDSIKAKANDFLYSIALKKGVKAAVVFFMSYMTSAKVSPILAQFGVTIDPVQLEVGLTTVATVVLTAFLNYLKVRVGIKFL